MSNTIDRRMRLSVAFAPQAIATSGEHTIAEMRWFPVREPVSGNRYTLLAREDPFRADGMGRVRRGRGTGGQSAGEGVARQIGHAVRGHRPVFAARRRSRYGAAGYSSARRAGRRSIESWADPTRHKVRAFTDSNEAAFSAVGHRGRRNLPPATRAKPIRTRCTRWSKQLPEDRDFVLSGQRVAHGGRCGIRGPRRRGTAPAVVRRALFGGQCSRRSAKSPARR